MTTICSATTKSGSQCKKKSMTDGELCFLHHKQRLGEHVGRKPKRRPIENDDQSDGEGDGSVRNKRFASPLPRHLQHLSNRRPQSPPKPERVVKEETDEYDVPHPLKMKSRSDRFVPVVPRQKHIERPSEKKVERPDERRQKPSDERQERQERPDERRQKPSNERQERQEIDRPKLTSPYRRNNPRHATLSTIAHAKKMLSPRRHLGVM